MSTTIQISESVKNQLEKRKFFSRETYNEVIENMIEDDLELNTKTVKELEEREKGKFISIDEVERHLRI